MKKTGILYNKDIPIAKVTYDTKDGTLQIKDKDVLDTKHIPIHAICHGHIKPTMDIFLQNRDIPESRDKLQDVLKALNIPTRHALAEESFFLSLSDQYWISPVDIFGRPKLHWKDVNFFENNFFHDIGNLLFNKKPDNDIPILADPVSTSGGKLTKMWVICNNQRYLLKGGNTENKQEPYNEVIASKIYEKLGFKNYVPYQLAKIETNNGIQTVSLCKNFCDSNTETVTLEQVLLSDTNQVLDAWHMPSILRDALEMYRCDENEVKRQFDIMDAVDYIIMNNDRHLQNVCFTRNFNTPDTIRIAPIFDSGNSLLFNMKELTNESVELAYNTPLSDYKGRRTFDDYTTSINPDNIDIEKLNGLDIIVRDVLSQSDLASEHIEFLCDIVKQRETLLREYLIAKQYDRNVDIKPFEMPNANDYNRGEVYYDLE